MSEHAPDAMSIAVIGMAGRFPGAGDVDAFWRNLRDGVESITFFDGPQDEAEPGPGDPSFVQAAGVLDDEKLFDARFFDVNPREAEITDPQQRLLLEVSWQALERSGYRPEDVAGSVGVFAGVGMNTYFVHNVLSHPEIFRTTPTLQVMIGADKDYVAPRLSYKLDLKGPSVSVQTACSTSLVAVHLACQSLLDDQCDLALAGGCSVRVPQRTGYWYQEGGIFSPDGHCRAFDARAAGTVAGSGVGVVVLKRLEDALADGDDVLAVVRGSAINNDGTAKVGFTAPSVEGQVSVIAEALAAAGVDGESITYVEAHGTGTALGDPIEVAALAQAFADDPRRGGCRLGSVKTNVGHLDTAAGIAGLIKTIQALRHKQIPPTLHFERPHPEIDFDRTPFMVNAELVDWRTPGGTPRRAGVSSFGIGGSNVHVVLEEAPAPRASGPARAGQLLVLSARTETALETLTDELARHLEDHPAHGLADVAHTLQVGRKRFEHRRTVVCSDRATAIAALRDRDPERVSTARGEAGRRAVAFLFPGQGAQHPGMTRGLYAAEPGFRQDVDDAARILEPHLGRDLRAALYPDGESDALRATALAQPALFVVEHALARLWMAWGVVPTAMIGHSIGEYVAATLAGVLSLEDALRIVAARGRLMQTLPAGAMLSLRLDAAELAGLLGEEVSLAASNGAGFHVVSGPSEAVATLERALHARDVETRRLRTSHAFHSAMMDPILDDFAAELTEVRLEAPRIPFLSNLTGTWITAEEATDPGYWVRHLRETVRFGDGLAELARDPARVLLEVGPGRGLGTLARRHDRVAREQVVLSSLPEREPATEQTALLRALGRLWLAGVAIDWRGFARDERRRRLALPTYPFERERFWLEPRSRPAPDAAVPADAGVEPETPSAAEPAPPAGAGHGRPELATDYVAPRSDAEETLAAIWREALSLDEVGVYDDFFELGGHSLLATRIGGLARQAFQVEISLNALFETPTIARMASALERARERRGDEAVEIESLPTLTPAPEDRHLPFSLTDVQQAYWIGRDAAYELGGVATHVYSEMTVGGVDPETMNRIWRRLIARHDMLRAIVLPDGTQQILPEVPPYKIAVLDLAGRTPEEAATALAELRREMSQQVLPADRWPLFEVRASRLDDGVYRLHVSFDMLIGDAWSWQLLVDEMGRLYRDPARALEPLEISFRDYVLAARALERSAGFRRDLEYWQKRLATFPTAPELPLAVRPASLEKPRFARLATTLGPEAWRRLKERAAGAGLTPSGLLLAAFAEVLTLWSKRPRFAVNLTLFNRLPLHPQVDALIGDFTSLTLLAVDNTRDAPFSDRAQGLQKQLWEDLDHRLVSAVRVLRELARLHGSPARAMMPVVFTSTLNLAMPGAAGETAPDADADADAAPPPAEDAYGISQTPQVWLDHQVTESGGRLFYNWDVVEDLFPPGLMRQMFDAYGDLIRRLATDDDLWRRRAPLRPPADQLQIRAAVNATAAPAPETRLHEPFQRQARQYPDRIAIVTDALTLSYGELARRAHALARALRRRRARPDRLVAVVMEKGWEQVVAVLGILEAGAAYLPIDAELPEKRRRHLLEKGEARIALTQARLLDTLHWPDGVEPIAVDRLEPAAELDFLEPAQRLDELAYVIFTSGSTGEPKGVMIEHRAAVNTLVDLWRRFDVGADDRVLAVSALSFDLSVYDVFGTLGTGGAIVLPPAGDLKDPAVWSRQMAEHRVSIWNSVPALMELVADHADGRAGLVPRSLRLVMLSGDWIPLALPDRVKALRPGARVVSLGGATEASIWSILHPIETLDPELPSVPYGRPMQNQTFHVLDHRLEPRPVWVPGELYIGGIGLARGYWRDEEKTAASFIVHPRSGERLYRTGDLGRYLPDGDIQFLGREDAQVKIRGFRIELGEIEATLDRHPGVRESVVLAQPAAGAEPAAGTGPPPPARLVAYVLPATPEAPSAEDLSGFLRDRVPAYMVPARYVAVDRWPLSPNGKVDRAALAVRSPAETATPAADAEPETATEKRLAATCRELLGVERVGVHDNFFELGGDSLLATRLIFQIRKDFDVELPVRSFFDAPSVAELAELVAEKLHALPPEKRARVEKRLRATAGAGDDATPRRPTARPSAPLSFVQSRLWRYAERHPGSPAHNVLHAVRLEGVLDVARLARAFGELARRHQPLRTAFETVDGEPRAFFAGRLAAPLPVVDLRAVPRPRQRQAVVRVLDPVAQKPFDLGRAPLWRLALFRLADDRHVLLLSIHHLIVDGWSLSLLVRELATLYAAPRAGGGPALPELPLPYGEFARWQRRRAARGEYDRELAYWRRRLDGYPRALGLPFRRGSATSRGRGSSCETRLPHALCRDLEAFARARRATPFIVCLAAFARLLQRHSGQDDFLIATPAAGRSRRSTEGLIGMFLNLLILRLDTAGDPTFDELVARVREVTLDAYSHQEVPYELVAAELAPEREPSRPLAPILFTLPTLGAGEDPALEAGGLRIEPFFTRDVGSEFELSFYAVPGRDGIRVHFGYDRDLYPAADVAAMTRAYRGVLEDALRHPDRRSTAPAEAETGRVEAGRSS